MVSKKFLILLLLTVTLGVFASVGDDAVPGNWQAGQTVTLEAVEALGGLDACFVSEEIPDGVWARMQGRSYQPNPYIGRNDLRYVRALHWDYDGKTHLGEMVCNKRIARRVVLILRTLYENRYPIERMVLPDNYMADDETKSAAANGNEYGICVEL